MVDVQPLDEFAIHQDHALALGFGLCIGVDDSSGKPELIFGGREHLVCGRELLRMDQGFPVEA